MLRDRGLEAVALDVFVADAPDGSAGCSEEELLDGHSGYIDSKKIRDVVVAVDEIRVQQKKNQKQSKIQGGETERANEHGGNEVGTENRNHDSANGKGDDSVVDGFSRMPELKREKDRYNNNEWREVAFASSFADHGKFFFQKNLSHHRSDASYRRGPEDIFDPHSDSLVEVEERRR